jgi:drug/metabolite transporter (DMT)-like permease
MPAANPALRGAVLMFIAVGAFSLMDATLKMFSTHYPPLQVSAMRAAASLPFILLPFLWSRRFAELRPNRPGLHLLRGVIGIVMLSLFIFSLRGGSLVEVYALYMFAPLLVVALAVPLLKEHADAGAWAAVAVGFIGVMIILRPDASALTAAAGIAASISALCYALAVITARLLTRTDTSSSMVFSFLLIIAVVCGALSIAAWVDIRAEHWPWLVATGVLGAVGQHTMTDAFRYAPASLLAPIEYTALLWGAGIDVVIWQIWPSVPVVIGATIIMAAGLFVVHRTRSPSTGVAAAPATSASATAESAAAIGSRAIDAHRHHRRRHGRRVARS